MKKYKIALPENYKSYFTLDDMEKIAEIKNMDDLQETIDCLVETYAGQYSDVLRVELEFCKDSGSCFFFSDSMVDVAARIYVLDGTEFLIKYATFTQINSICGDRDSVGYIQKYQRVYK